MLMRHTTKQIKEREALTINPAKACQPIGAMYAALGIHGCLPHSHGSQGCCAYHRSALTRHYREPVMAATSSFTEGSSVFGGQANLLTALENIFAIYDPAVVAIHSTCLSETIGDDLPQIISKAITEGMVPKGKVVLYANTPSYIGSHVTGYSTMVRNMVDQLARNTGNRTTTINIACGWVEPSDMREIKRLAAAIGARTILFPDTSDVLDTPLDGTFHMYPAGGVTVEKLVLTGDSSHTIGLGEFTSEAAAKVLDAKCHVPYTMLDIPIGLGATDRFVMTLAEKAGIPIPDSIAVERGRVVDIISDMEQYFSGKRVALWGDPDILVPLTEFLVDLNMQPVYIVSGTPGKSFEERIRAIAADKVPGLKVKNGPQADMYLMHQWIKNESVDLLIGNTYGKFIAKDENIPFMRMGFPIYDRVGHSYNPQTCYAGCMRIVLKMLDLFLDKIDADSPDTSFGVLM